MVSKQRLHEIRFPERARARAAVKAAVANGHMPPVEELPCTFCDKPACEYHHHMGYEQECWLAVLPLCKECHDSQPKSERIYLKRDRAMQPKVEPNPLVGALIERQDALQLGDEAFAQELGVTRVWWCYVRRYQCPPGKKLIDNACRRFPDLATAASPARSCRTTAIRDIVKGTLVEHLIRKEIALDLTIEQFADKLGISRSLWAETKLGKRPIGRKLIAGAQSQFPELFTDADHNASDSLAVNRLQAP